MPTAPPLSRPTARPRNRQVRSVALIVAAIAATIALLAITSSMLTGPDRVDLTIENPTAYHLSVEVRGAEDGSVHRLGTVSSESTRDLTGVIDQGEMWWFEFSYGGVIAAELTVSQSTLEAGPVVVPDSAGEVLAQAGLSPPPG